MSHAHLVLIVDRSGSMAGKEGDVVGGINNFLKDQRNVPGTADVSIMKFDHEFELAHQQLNAIKDWEPTDFVPRGNTALLDAIGRTMTEVGSRIQTTKPDVVVCVIVTDGFENASHEYKREQIKQMIAHAEKHSWRFMYLGADASAFAEAAALGIPQNMTAQYANTSVGTQSAYANMAGTTAHLRSAGAGASINVNLSQQQKDIESKLKQKSA